MTTEEKSVVLQRKKTVVLKFWFGLALIFIIFPCSFFAAYLINKYLQLESIALWVMMFGFFLGIPAGILIAMDNIRYGRWFKKTKFEIEEYGGVVEEGDIYLLPQIQKYIGPCGQDISIEMISDTNYVFSINGQRVFNKNIFIERSLISKHDVAYAVSVYDENLLENQKLEKRHMSDDEVAEIERIIKNNKKYFSLGRLITLFFGGFYLITLWKIGFAAFFTNNILFGIMGGFFILVMILDHGNFFNKLKLNKCLRRDVASREVWILKTVSSDNTEIVEEALVYSNLVWSIQGVPAHWRVFKVQS